MTRWLRALTRCFIAALWALPGPILVGLFLAITLGPYDYDFSSDLRPVFQTLARNVVACMGWFVVQVPVALAYGTVRAIFGTPNLKHGVFCGAIIWTLLALSIVCAGSSLRGGPPIYFGGAPVNGGAPSSDLESAFFVVRITFHILGGAIAGFHVDHYLLREAKRSAR